MRKGTHVARLGQTLRHLSQNRRQWVRLLATATPQPSPLSFNAPPGRLREVPDFGSNPGKLRMLTYVPPGLAPASPLVVVLHGCTQTAACYDHGAGWSTLADRYGFALVFPEQQQANNPRLCFNWFQPGDIARERGEASSIRQMVEHMTREHDSDRQRVFVNGLSAGG